MSSEVKKFDPLVGKIEKAIAPMREMKCTDPISKDLMIGALRVAKGYDAEVAATGKAMRDPHTEASRLISAREKEIRAPLGDLIDSLNRQLVQYDARIRAEQEAERRRLEDERRENDRRAREDLAQAQVIAPDAASLAEEQNRITTAARVKQEELKQEKAELNAESVSNVRHNWKFRITDEALIPGAYCKPDEVAIGKVVRAMGAKATTVISGIEVWDEPSVASGSVAPPRAGRAALR